MTVPKTELAEQIAHEAEVLFNAPVIKAVVGQASRCHLCGRVVPASDLKLFDEHIRNSKPRLACSLCHPQRSSL